MACKRCGKCCRNYAVPAPLDDEDLRFLVYHGVVMRRAANGQVQIYGESRCSKLKSDGKGRYKCAIYETRPRLCRDWLCDAARKGE